MPTRTNVYIDAFNLYFGALKNSPYRWLDLRAFCKKLLPQNRINHIKYYTARVKPRPNDPQQPARQQAYLRAIATLPEVSVHFGHFLSHPVRMPLASDPSKFAQVIKTEEKGSDVNLATHLLADGFRNEYDVAVIISNDSDLLEPIKIVRNDLKKTVGVVNPQIKSPPSKPLLQNANFFRNLRRGALASSQFPVTLTDKHGTFHKPAAW